MDIELLVKSQRCGKYAQVSLHHLVLEYLYFVSANEQEMSHFRLPAENTTKASAIIKCQNQTLLPSLYQKQQ